MLSNENTNCNLLNKIFSTPLEIANYEADELLMQTCMAITETQYYVVFGTGAKRLLGKDHYKNNRFDRTKIQKLLNKYGKRDCTYTIEKESKCTNLNKAIFLVQKQLRKIQYNLKCRIVLWLGPTDMSNFRFTSAKTQPYKSNRFEKPEIYEKLRQYLIDVLGANVIHGYEADDALGIYQTDKSIAVHCDKDICQIPGWHYNTMLDASYYVEDLGALSYISEKKVLKGTGKAFFYAQLLMGDRTDTIPSIPHPRYKGWGAKTVHDIFIECTSETEYLGVVVNCYKTVFADNWKERLYEQADLVWICRKEGEYGSSYLKSIL